jgi:hypothetical protein
MVRWMDFCDVDDRESGADPSETWVGLRLLFGPGARVSVNKGAMSVGGVALRCACVK